MKTSKLPFTLNSYRATGLLPLLLVVITFQLIAVTHGRLLQPPPAKRHVLNLSGASANGNNNTTTTNGQEISKEMTVVNNENNKYVNTDDNSTCTSFSSYEDYMYSTCGSSIINRDKLTILKDSIPNNETWNRDFWCSCENHPCSLIYRVEKGAKVKNIYLTGFVDSRAEIIILAEYASDQGEFFQLGKLRGDNENYHSEHLKRIKFDYLHEDFLDVCTLNVTMALNGGFCMIEDFVVIVEVTNDTEVIPISPSPPEVITLDTDEDAEDYEWIEITCNYGMYHDDFWVYGCPQKSGSDHYHPEAFGFWSTCQEPDCAFTYDGSRHAIPKSVVITGYFQGGTVEVTGKNHILDTVPWRMLKKKDFHGNTPVFEHTFDLTDTCDMKVLQINIETEDKSVIIIDKIKVLLESASHNVTRSCPPIPNEKELESAGKSTVDNSGESTSPKILNFVLSLLLFAHYYCAYD